MSEFSSSAATVPKRTAAPLPQDIEGKLLRAAAHKDEGNEYFKVGNYKKAISCYAKVVAYTKGLPGSKRGGMGGGGGIVDMVAGSMTQVQVTPEEDQHAIDLETISYTNMATCYLKLNEPRKALEQCAKALELTPTAWKAVLRKAEAQMQQRDTDTAKITLAEALELAPEAAKGVVLKEREKLAALIKEESAKQKKAFSKLFEKSNGAAADASSS